MAEQKTKKLDEKALNKKINELKIELLKQTHKRKNIKKEIARALTQKQQNKITKTKQTGGRN